MRRKKDAGGNNAATASEAAVMLRWTLMEHNYPKIRREMQQTQLRDPIGVIFDASADDMNRPLIEHIMSSNGMTSGEISKFFARVPAPGIIPTFAVIAELGQVRAAIVEQFPSMAGTFSALRPAGTHLVAAIARKGAVFREVEITSDLLRN